MENMEEFEIDFATCVNMFSGMSYEEAVKQAREEYIEDHKDETKCKVRRIYKL
jgi:hypothetical protein